MIIPLDKLVTYNENKYIFTKSAMRVIDKIGNVSGYLEDDKSWKVVPNVLKLFLNGDLKINFDDTNKEEI